MCVSVHERPHIFMHICMKRDRQTLTSKETHKHTNQNRKREQRREHCTTEKGLSSIQTPKSSPVRSLTFEASHETNRRRVRDVISWEAEAEQMTRGKPSAVEMPFAAALGLTNKEVTETKRRLKKEGEEEEREG